MKKALIFSICFLLVCAALCSCGGKRNVELTEPVNGQSETVSEVTLTAPAGEDQTTGKGSEATTEKTEQTTSAAKEKSTEKPAEKTTVETTAKAAPAGELKVKYIRENGGDYEAPSSAMIISSAEVLKARYGNSGTGELAALCREYTAEYFKTGVLLIVTTAESSGSITHKVTGVDNNNGELCVNVKTTTPEVGTCDMAVWHIVVEYPAGDYSKITVNKK